VRAFLTWFDEIEARAPGEFHTPAPPLALLGLKDGDLPEDFRRFASALAYSVRPVDGVTAAEARAHARILVAGALTVWLYRDRKEAS